MKSWKTGGGHIIAQVFCKRCNVYLISRNDKNILIDTARRTALRRLLGNLNDLKVEGIDALILTHTHFDHAENAANIVRKYGPKVIVHELEAQFLESGNSPLPHGTIMPARFLVALFGNAAQKLVKYEACKVDLKATDRRDLSDFGFNARIIHTPGHTLGSVSIIVDDEIALVGDTLFGAVPWSVFPPFADNVDQLMASWRKLLESRCEIFLPAHGSPISRKRFEQGYNKHRR